MTRPICLLIKGIHFLRGKTGEDTNGVKFAEALLLFFLYSYCWPCWSCTWINIYFKLKYGVLFWQRDYKSSWSAYWPSLRPDKNHKLSRHVPPLKQLNFFQCQLTSWQTTHSTPQTVLIYTQHPPVTHWRKLNLPFVHRLNHQYYYPKISTGFAPKK